MCESCYHCGEDVPAETDFKVEILGSVRPMCCPGCETVAQTIIDSGLVSYYQYRTAPAEKADLVPEQLLALQRAVRKLLRQLESISIRIKHGLLDEQICKDYMASISVQVLENCKPFIDSERLHRSDNRIFEHFERTANRWRL